MIKEPGKSITVIDNKDIEAEHPSISASKILKFDVVEITDWLDEQNLIVAMENRELDKMSLLENSEKYSRGIYLYNIETKDIKPLKVKEDMFLGGATLSPNKNTSSTMNTLSEIPHIMLRALRTMNLWM